VTSNYENITFVLPDYERVETGKHKLRISKLVVDKDDLYYTDLETLVDIAFEGETSWRDLWKKWRQAFDVEKVTERFFLDYQGTFFKVRSTVTKQKIATRDAHEFTLQLLNRIMFIYFVSKKRWLNNDPKFMRWLWKRYLLERNKGKTGKDSFYSNWLTVVFFEAFNNKFRNNTPLPDDVKKVFRDAPYLNGGLFRKGDLDNLSVRISDELFKGVFEFFERYNFTIREDLLDAEVAVDPQMIGYVYESLANVAESSYEREEDLRGAWGIFYTPRIEVEFMCKRALVEYLANHMPQVPKEKLYEFVFDEDKEKAEIFLQKEGLWYDLEDLLDNLSVVDPACGSGAFLVGMVNVLSELYRIIYRHMKRDLTDFELKNKIIMRSLYGVDVMPWAVHAAELRMWLQLIVESDLRPEDMKAHPLLPNLNMNLRIGDSLVQVVGGINLHVRDPAIGPKLKQRLLELKSEKEKYFNNNPTAKFKSKDDLENEEIRIFAEVIKDRVSTFLEEKNKLLRKLQELERGVQKDLYGNIAKTPPEELEPIKNHLLDIENEVNILEKVAKTLHDPEKKPFVWEIGFAEIFGEKGGFDIVIGNPPYVKHQEIAPPDKPRDQVTDKEKQRYKEKLVQSVSAHFPCFSTLDKRSDYYIYFYFHGLALLNKSGTFCFITSNSWLDALYGSRLQEFILKYAPIVAIYDNPKRAFAHAEVNTIIALFRSPILVEPQSLLHDWSNKSKLPALSNIARFVMFRKPFEEVVSSKCFVAIEKASKITQQPEFRICPIIQEELLEEGWQYPEGHGETEGKFSSGEYVGNFIGARYLRAPDVFFTIQEKGTTPLCKLKRLATIETYLNTGGADDFFFVQEVEKGKTTSRIMNTKYGEEFTVETNFVADFIESPRELESIIVSPETLAKKLFRVPSELTTSELRKTKASNYIVWGQKHGFSKVSGRKGKEQWYVLPSQAFGGADIIVPCRLGDIYAIFYNPEKIVSHRFYRIKAKDQKVTKSLAILLNCTLSYLCLELFRNPMTGGGVLDIGKPAINNILVVDPKLLSGKVSDLGQFLTRRSEPIFQECGFNLDRPFREQDPHPMLDRKKLDDTVFDIIGLTEMERRDVYWSICELVKARLDKAKSLKKRKD
jgi:hypothetical protein